MGENELFPKLPGTLIELRKKKKCSLREVSEQTGITAAALSAYEQGSKTPILVNAAKLADFYGVTLDELVGRVTPKPEPGRNFVEAAKAYHQMRTYIAEPPIVELEELEWVGDDDIPNLFKDKNGEHYKFEEIEEYLNKGGPLVDDGIFPRRYALLHYTMMDDTLARFINTYEQLCNLMNDGDIPESVFKLWLTDQIARVY